MNIYIYILSLKNLKNRNLLGINNIRHVLSGVENCKLNKPPWRVGVRNIMKNFSAPKYLAYVTSHYYQVHHCVMNTMITTLKVSTVTKPAPHRFYWQIKSFAHLDKQHTFKWVTFRVLFWKMCYINIFKQGWFKSNYIHKKPENFDNPVKFGLGGSQPHCEIPGCKNVAIIRCSWCQKSLCFKHFFNEYHFCSTYTP